MSQAVGIFWGAKPLAADAGEPKVQSQKQTSGVEARRASFNKLSPPEQALFTASDTLAEVLERVVKRIKAEIEVVQKRPKAPFDPRYHAAPGKRYYPESVHQEHRDYFVQEREREALQIRQKRSQISDYDAAPLEIGKFANPKLKERPWLSVLSKNEEEHVRMKFQTRMYEKGRPFRKAANTKLQWVSNSKRQADHRLKRLEHLLYIVQEEQQKDLQRDLRLFDTCDARQRRKLGWEIARDRTEAADMVMRLLDDYRLISATEMGDYLLAGNEFFERQLQVPLEPIRRVSTAPANISRRSRSPSRKSAKPHFLHNSKALASKGDEVPIKEGNISTLTYPRSASTPLWSQADAREALLRRKAESEAAMQAVHLQSLSVRAATAQTGITSTTLLEQITDATSVSGLRPMTTSSSRRGSRTSSCRARRKRH